MYNFAYANKNFPWLHKGDKLIDTREDAMALLTVRRNIGGLAIYADSTKISYHVGKNSYVENVQRAQAHIPALLHKNPTNAIVIGMGAGITSGAMTLHSNLKMIDTIELFPKVIDLMHYFKNFNEDIIHKTNSRLYAADGRYFLAASKKKYDIISVNITNPYLPGCAAFYTMEFYKLVKSKLNKNGIFLTHIYGPDWKFLVKSISVNFPYVRLFRGYPGTMFLIGSMEKMRFPTYREWLKKTNNRRLKRSLNIAWLPNLYTLIYRQMYNNQFIDRIRKDKTIPLHVDDLPLIEYKLFKNKTSSMFSISH